MDEDMLKAMARAHYEASESFLAWNDLQEDMREWRIGDMRAAVAVQRQPNEAAEERTAAVIWNFLHGLPWDTVGGAITAKERAIYRAVARKAIDAMEGD